MTKQKQITPICCIPIMKFRIGNASIKRDILPAALIIDFNLLNLNLNGIITKENNGS